MRFSPALGCAGLATMAALLVSGNPVNASGTNGYGTPGNPVAGANGGERFSVTVSSRSMPPSCAAGEPAAWVIDTTTKPGKAQLQLLQWAIANNRRVAVTGKAVCDVQSDAETVAILSVESPSPSER